LPDPYAVAHMRAANHPKKWNTSRVNIGKVVYCTCSRLFAPPSSQPKHCIGCPSGNQWQPAATYGMCMQCPRILLRACIHMSHHALNGAWLQSVQWLVASLSRSVYERSFSSTQYVNSNLHSAPPQSQHNSLREA